MWLGAAFEPAGGARREGGVALDLDLELVEIAMGCERLEQLTGRQLVGVDHAALAVAGLEPAVEALGDGLARDRGVEEGLGDEHPRGRHTQGLGKCGARVGQVVWDVAERHPVEALVGFVERRGGRLAHVEPERPRLRDALGIRLDASHRHMGLGQFGQQSTPSAAHIEHGARMENHEFDGENRPQALRQGSGVVGVVQAFLVQTEAEIANRRYDRSIRSSWQKPIRRPATMTVNTNPMPDVQGSVDKRRIAIDRVGVKAVRHPLSLIDRSGAAQSTVAVVGMNVGLPHDKKGTHMSRFLQVLRDEGREVSVASIEALSRRMVDTLEADSGRLELAFPFFVDKAAPVSGERGLIDYDVELVAEVQSGVATQTLKVVVPVTTLCPCSKEISEYGAHNQRGHITVTVESAGAVWIEEIIDLVEDKASCEVYGVLKRPDEKFVTERAYENPKFVEDVVRDVASALKSDARLSRWIVEVENFESIHNHSAYAYIEGSNSTA